MRIDPFRPAGLLPAFALTLPAAIGAQTAPPPAPPTTMAPPMAMPGAMGASQAPCPAVPAALPRELAGWTAAVPLAAAGTTGGLALATLEPGRGVRATLLPVARVTYPVAPGHVPTAGTNGGLFGFAVTQAGTYRVALGAGAWVDVVKDGQAIASIAHGHGPVCSPIRKTVDFTLAPGRYLLEISGYAGPTLTLMVAPVAG